MEDHTERTNDVACTAAANMFLYRYGTSNFNVNVLDRSFAKERNVQLFGEVGE
jgi:hypothetical protein